MWERSGRVAVLRPVGVKEHAVDLLEVDGLGAVSDRLEQGAEAEITHAAQDAVGRAHAARERVRGEHRMREPCAIELGADERGDVVWRELRQEDRVRDAAAQILRARRQPAARNGYT